MDRWGELTERSNGYRAERARMVRRIAAATNIHDPELLAAFALTPRHVFVPESELPFAYDDRALPIGYDQTISQPSMLAIMLAALAPERDDRVLEVGAGSGYAAALLGALAREVYAVEIVPELARRADDAMRAIGRINVHVLHGDGRRGLPERAPFQRILVSAGAEAVPDALVEQLEPGGRIAIPVGRDGGQTLLVGTRQDDGTTSWERSVPCMFVPLVGRA